MMNLWNPFPDGDWLDIILYLMQSPAASLPLEPLRIIAAVAGCAIGAYFDIWNNKNIPNYFIYGFLALALLINFAAYEPTSTWYGIGWAAVLFASTYILYKFGQLGGADPYILASIALLLPVQPTLLLQLPVQQFLELPFALNLLLATSLFFMAYMLLRSLPIAAKSIATPKSISSSAWLGAILIVAAFGAFSFVAGSMPYLPESYFTLVSIIAAVMLYFVLFKDALNRTMVEWVGAKKVEAEDVLALELLDKKVISSLSLSRLVDEKMAKRIRSSKLSKLPVYTKLPPFIPHIFAGLLLVLFAGNVVGLFLAGGL